jgi:ankyrin repeat protein
MIHMLRRSPAAVVLLCLPAGASAQAPGKIDFRRDVQPIFKTYCVGCHGATQQMNGLRLDRRRDAMKGGTIPVIGIGSSGNSRLYLKLLGSQFGPQMPPTGPLSAEQIETIKNWIDQGAVWPDDASGETALPPPDPQATRMMESLRTGDRATFQKTLRENSKAANLAGPGGVTPLMYAALYGDTNSVRRLLEAGADPNARNESGATALMWAVGDPERTRLLLEHKADANARSENGRTPLLIAADRFGSAPVLKLLLEAGANVNFAGLRGASALGEAASLADEAAFRLLLDRGADPKTAGASALALARRAGCAFCFDTLLKAAPPQVLAGAAVLSSPPREDAAGTKVFLDHGVSPGAKDPEGRTLLMRAANSDLLPLETVNALLERGAEINAKDPLGHTALDFARRRGTTPVVEALLKAGATHGQALADSLLQPDPAESARAAVARSLPLLQQADVTFLRKSGCLSCHHNSLTAMAVVAARKNGIPVNDRIETQQLKATVNWLDNWRDRLLQGAAIPGDVDTIGYVLLGLAAENHPADATTDALAYFMLTHQAADGRWRLFAYRPPLEGSEIEVTAAGVRSVQVYAPKPQRAEYDHAVKLAADWLMKAEPMGTEDHAFQLLGLHWAGANKDVVRKIARELLGGQRPDGGWAQIPTLTTDAYATGQALYALHESGVLAVSDPAYQRGVEYLRNTQMADGSWYVRSRTFPVQPYFESDFPHGADQFISAAATNWAVLALAPAAR